MKITKKPSQRKLDQASKVLQMPNAVPQAPAAAPLRKRGAANKIRTGV